MEKGQGKGTDTLPTDNVFTRKEYIEREAVCYQLAKQATIDGQPRAIRRAAKIVADFPAADVVPVVRCGECVHWDRYENTAGCGYCHKVKFEYGANGYVFNPVREPDFFCADGARMDGDGDGV